MKKPTNIRKEYFIYVANNPRQKTIELIGQNNIDKLRKVLSDITQEGKITETPELDHFIRMAESYKATTEETIIDGKIKDYERIETPYLSGMLTSKEQNFMRFELSRSLCLFMGEKKDNVKKIKQCLMCNNFFIAKDVKRIICYKNKACYNEWYAQYMKRRRKLAKKTATKTK